MKIIYKFDDGTTSEVEVDEELGMFISAEDKKEQNEQRKQRYRFLSLDVFLDVGVEFDTVDSTLRMVQKIEEEQLVEDFMKTLSEKQRNRLLIKMENPELSYREIARIEGVDIKSILQTFELIEKLFKKFINSTPSK